MARPEVVLMIMGIGLAKLKWPKTFSLVFRTLRTAQGSRRAAPTILRTLSLQSTLLNSQTGFTMRRRPGSLEQCTAGFSTIRSAMMENRSALMENLIHWAMVALSRLQ